MATIQVSAVMPASPAEVWAYLRDIGNHVEWMADAESIRFLTEAVEGVGVRFECATRIGPIRLTDVMEVTEWREEQTMGIRHRGVVSGSGLFRLTPVPGTDGQWRTEFEWTETLRFPWWMGGGVGAVAAAPLLRAVWKRNLVNLADRVG